MRRRIEYTRFSVTMTGALLVFLGAAILGNAGSVTTFVVRLVGFSCAVFALMIATGELLHARTIDDTIDSVPFEELVGAGILLLVGVIVALFPGLFAKVLFSTLGLLIVLSGLGDLVRARRMVADDDQRQRVTLTVGIATIAVGAFVAFVPSAAMRAVPIVCGLALVVDGLSELYLALRMVERE